MRCGDGVVGFAGGVGTPLDAMPELVAGAAAPPDVCKIGPSFKMKGGVGASRWARLAVLTKAGRRRVGERASDVPCVCAGGVQAVALHSGAGKSPSNSKLRFEFYQRHKRSGRRPAPSMVQTVRSTTGTFGLMHGRIRSTSSRVVGNGRRMLCRVGGACGCVPRGVGPVGGEKK